MSCPDPLASQAPSSPMMDDRSPRIRLTLSIWTLVLIGSVLVEARRLPPGLTALLVPYLVLMAWHWMSRLRRRGSGEPAIWCDGAAGSPSDDESGECADSPGSGDRPGSINPHQPASADPPAEQASPRSRRGRARRRVKAHEPEPLAASWVQVQPGRFVRFEEISPEHAVDESGGGSRIDAPHGATPLAETAVTPEAGSIPAATETAVTESESGVDHVYRDVAETIVPEDREIGEEAIAGTVATTAYLIGCPPGAAEDPGSSPPSSGARSEVEADDRREDTVEAETPEIELGWDKPVDLARWHEEQRAI